MKNPLNKPFAGHRACARKGSGDKGNDSVNTRNNFDIEKKESRAVSPFFRSFCSGSGASGRFFCALNQGGKGAEKVCKMRGESPIPIHNIRRGKNGYALRSPGRAVNRIDLSIRLAAGLVLGP